MSAMSMGFGRRQAYESLTCTTRGGLSKVYEDFAFRTALGSH